MTSPHDWFLGGCNVDIYGNDRWLWGTEGLPEGHDASAGRIAPHIWRINDSSGVIGYATQLSARRWELTDQHWTPVATVAGPDGPAVAMMLLRWGWECFPHP